MKVIDEMLMPITARISTGITIATTSRVTSGQKRSVLSTATEGQGAVLALPLCLEGLVFSPASGCRSSALPKPLGPGLSASA